MSKSVIVKYTSNFFNIEISLMSSYKGSRIQLLILFLQSIPKLLLFKSLKKSLSTDVEAFCLDFLKFSLFKSVAFLDFSN